MEIIIIVGAIGIVFAHIFLSPKLEGEIAQKRNPGFKSSLRHNPDNISPEEVFDVLKENNIKPCFLEVDLIKQDNGALTDTTLVSSYDRVSLFNPQPKDNRSTLKVIKDGLKKVSEIKIESQKDALDDISQELLSKLTEEHQFEEHGQSEHVLTKKLTSPRNIRNKHEN